MTLTNTSPLRNDYDGNGVTVDFTVAFPFLEDEHLAVYDTLDSTGVSTLKTLNSDYTVTGAGNENGGGVHFTTAPATGHTISVLLDVPLTQETHYVEGDPFPAASHERALDKLTLIDRQQQEEIDRCFKLAVSDGTTDPTLPAAQEGYVLGWVGGVLRNLSAATAQLAADLLSSAVGKGAALITYLAPFTGTAATTQHEVNQRRVSVFDWFSSEQKADVLARTCALDVTAEVQAAVDAVNATGGGEIFFPRGIYRFAQTVPNFTGANYGLARINDGVRPKSNVHFIGEGDNTAFRQDQYQGSILHTHLNTSITTDEANLKNIAIRNIRFENPNAAWKQEIPLVYIESCQGLLIENCSFIGYCGDALTLGPTAQSNGADVIGWLPMIMKDVRVTGCTFDGVLADTRNCISISNGQNVEIDSNTFRNSGRSDMPGAIDLECESTNDVVSNFLIHDNKFSAIGGAAGVIGFNVTAAVSCEEVHAYDNQINWHTNTYAFYVSGKGGTSTTLPAGGAARISFRNNTVKQAAGRFFLARGVDGLVISDNVMTGSTAQSLFGALTDTQPLLNFTMTGNTFRDIKVISTANDAVFYIQGNIVKAEITKNVFLNCGVWSDAATPIGQNILVFDATHALASNWAVISDNTISGHGTAFVAATTIPFLSVGTLTNAANFILSNNRVLGGENTTYQYGLQRFVSVADSLVAASDWNPVGAYTDADLPDSFKPGLSISLASSAALTALTGSGGGAVLWTIRTNRDTTADYHTMQFAFSYGASTKIWQRHAANPVTNSWGTWATFTGA